MAFDEQRTTANAVAPALLGMLAFCEVASEKRKHDPSVKRATHSVHTPLSLRLQTYDSKKDKLVEAAGVEPASEIVVS